MTVFWIMAALAAAYVGVTFFLFYIACWRFEVGPAFSKFLGGSGPVVDFSSPAYKKLVRESKTWLEGLSSETLEIRSFDGLTLRGRLYHNPEAKGVLVACHGFHSSGVSDFGPACPFYYGLGFSLLLIDQRACGESEGRYATYGVRERRDAKAWCELMAERFPALPIALGGVSLGGATVLMASDDLPEQVKVVIDDCGFTDPYQQLEFVGRRSVNFKAGVDFLLLGVDVWCRLLAHFRLREWSAVQALEKTTRPVLFIHGRSDTLVPYSCTEVNRAACAAPSALFSVADAGHGTCFLCDTDSYKKAVTGFLHEHFFSQAEV